MLFALCVRLAFKQKDATTLREVVPLEKNFSKPPMKTLLHELKQHVAVSPAFEEKLTDVIERRHLLIHRWGIERGLPAGDAAHHEIAVFAAALASDAHGLARMLHGYVIDWMRRFPELADALEQMDLVWLSQQTAEFATLKVEKNHQIESAG
jgi:hypothetical protein